MQPYNPPAWPVFYPGETTRQLFGGTRKAESAGTPTIPGLLSTAQFGSDAAKVVLIALGAELFGLGALYYFTSVPGWWLLVLFFFDIVGAVLFHAETWVRRMIANHLFLWDTFDPNYQTAKVTLESNVKFSRRVARCAGFLMVTGCCVFKVVSIQANEIPGMMLLGINLAYVLAVWVHLTSTGYLISETCRRFSEMLDRRAFRAGVIAGGGGPIPNSAPAPSTQQFHSTDKNMQTQPDGFGPEGQHQLCKLGEESYELRVAGLLDDGALIDVVNSQGANAQARLDVARAAKWLQLQQMPAPDFKVPANHPPFLRAGREV